MSSMRRKNQRADEQYVKNGTLYSVYKGLTERQAKRFLGAHRSTASSSQQGATHTVTIAEQAR